MSKFPEQQEFQQAGRLKEELLEAIEKHMEQHEISQGEVARRISAHRYNVNKVMRRKAPVTLDFLLKIAESIGMKVDLKIHRSKP